MPLARRPHRKNSGFTLIELSIVLVILGLIVGGIVGGKSLIHQAELNKVIADLNGYKTAFNAYVNQYDSIPGDHAEATQYWPGQTADGNGDGMIWDTGSWNAGNSRYEDEKSFSHLGLAEIIPFRAAGTFVDGNLAELGVHLPKGPVDGQGYRFESVPCGQWQISNSTGLNQYGRQGTRLVAGKIDTGTDLWMPFLKPADARNIDTKMDDGKPASGQLMANEATNGDCVEGKTGDSDADKGDNKYNVGNAAVVCNIGYWMN